MNLILHKVLADQNLDVWSKLRKEFFIAPYTEIYYLINRFYQKNDRLPSFQELEIVTRDEKQANYITALKELEVPDDLDIDIILQATINEFAQRQVLERISKYLDELVFKDVSDIVEDLSAISIEIEEKTEVNEQIVEMSEFMTIDMDTIFSRVPLGLNNDFDAYTMGMAPEEFVVIGGHRGSGKSIICSNVVCNQYLQGNTSLYFTIEMGARELYNRNLAILSGVPEKHIKAGNLSSEEQLSIVNVRAKMTADGSSDLLEGFKADGDFNNFERQLIDRPLGDSRIVTIDNSNLTIANIDATIHKFKTMYEDKLKVVVVDYINQITSTSNDIYDWKTQIELSKKLKALARKYEIVLLSPFQTSEEGKVRFSKGILDSPNWAFVATPVHEGEYGAIEFECIKARGDAMANFASEIHWPTLKIYPNRNRKLMKDQIKEKKLEDAVAKNQPKTEDDLKL